MKCVLKSYLEGQVLSLQSWSYSYNSQRSFSYNSFVKFHFVKFYGKKIGSQNKAMLYPNLCTGTFEAWPVADHDTMSTQISRASSLILLF